MVNDLHEFSDAELLDFLSEASVYGEFWLQGLVMGPWTEQACMDACYHELADRADGAWLEDSHHF